MKFYIGGLQYETESDSALDVLKVLQHRFREQLHGYRAYGKSKKANEISEAERRVARSMTREITEIIEQIEVGQAQ